MQLAAPSLCDACVHLSKIDTTGLGVPSTCTAFPISIPGGYFGLGKPHIKPDGEDNGITFKFNPERQASLDLYKKYFPDVVI